MRELLLGGGTGLVLGIAVQRMGLTRRECLRQTAALRNRQALRVLLMSLGLSALLVSLLMWLAVIDVDELRVVPLHGGTVLGGLLFGAVIGWTGQTPGSAAASLGGDRFFEGACGVAGCLAGAALLPVVRSVFPAIRSLLPESGLTWFRVTLDKPYLFAGGFLGQGCAGLLLLALSLYIRREHSASAPAEKPAAPPPISENPEDVREDTVVATLPGEEPVVVDMAEEPAESENAPVDGESSAEQESAPIVEEPSAAEPELSPAEDAGDAAEALSSAEKTVSQDEPPQAAEPSAPPDTPPLPGPENPSPAPKTRSAPPQRKKQLKPSAKKVSEKKKKARKKASP